MIKWIVALSLLLGRTAPEDDYPALLAAEAAKRRQRDEEQRAAHQALDEGHYEKAVELARHVRLLDEEVVRARHEIRACLKTLVAGLVEKLDDDAFPVREAASEKLRELGVAARAELARIRRTVTSPEVRYRIDELLPGLSVDAEGRIHQWASEATASSEYTPTDWSAKQVIGAPDTLQGGDARTAWAAKEADAGEEWIRVAFPLPLKISKIRVLENYVPGGIVAVDVIGCDGTRRRAWEGSDPGGEAPVWFEADLKGVRGRELVIVLDTKKNSGWEEIDAVELLGELLDD
jgi:TolA-binding protein